MKLPVVLSMALFSFTAAFSQRQGITGKVEWLSGNQMPGPERVAIPARGISRTIWVYQAVTGQDATSDGMFFTNIKARLIKKVKSKSDGRFNVKLRPGVYSLFVEEEKGLFANRFDGMGRINSVEVKKRKFTEISILVDYEAAY